LWGEILQEDFCLFFCHGLSKAEEANLKLHGQELKVCLSYFLKPKSHCNLEVRALVEEQDLIITVAKYLQAPPFSVMLLQPVTLTQVITRSHQIYSTEKRKASR